VGEGAGVTVTGSAADTVVGATTTLAGLAAVQRLQLANNSGAKSSSAVRACFFKFIQLFLREP
jgi:hypothetical protein